MRFGRFIRISIAVLGVSLTGAQARASCASVLNERLREIIQLPDWSQETQHESPFKIMQGRPWPVTKLQNATVFYPFGGADVYTPVRIARGISRIVSVQLFPFGNVEAGLRRLKESSEEAFEAVFAQRYGMLSSPTLASFAARYGGVGLLALLQIQSLGARIDSIAALEWKNGEWVETPWNAEGLEPSAHGKIRFHHRGQEIDYYLLQGNLADRAGFLRRYPRNLLPVEADALQGGFSFESLKALTGVAPELTILKALHQGYEGLRAEFKKLHEILDQSPLIYSDFYNGDLLPNHEVLFAHTLRDAIFGTGRLHVWKKKP